MEQNEDSELGIRIKRLEQRLRLFQVVTALAALVLVAGIFLARRSSLHNDRSPEVLRVRGLVVEDDKGRERVLIGAPVPKVAGRKRQDDTVGLIILGENGADRVALASPGPNPQINGHVRKRIGTDAGLLVNDSEGNERGGFGVLDNDSRVVLGLDYPRGMGEAITLSVIPQDGASLQLHDTHSFVRAALIEHKDSAAKLYGLEFRNKSTLDLTIVQLSPYVVKRAVIAASDEALTKALDSMEP
jgi:hypothetical protein